MFCSLLISSRAHAQGTNGMLPDPISAQDLDEYAKRLDLSAQQRSFMQSYHEEYKTKFAELRDGDIDKFLKDNSGMQAMARLMDRKAAESALHDYENIVNKIKAMDSALFDQMQGMLTQDQSAKLDRVKQARERERYKAGFGRFSRMGTPAARVDLSEIAEDLDLSKEEETQVDPAIAAYENLYTIGMRKQYEGGIEATMDMVKAMESAGVSPQSMQGENRQQMFRTMEGMWRGVMDKMNEYSTSLAELNSRTVKSVSGLMSQEHGRDFKQHFYQRAYPEIGGKNGNTDRALDAAKQLDGLTADQKQAVNALAQDYNTKDDSLVDQMVALANKAWAAGGFGGGPGRGDRGDRSGNDEAQQARQKIHDMRQQREELAENTMTQLRAFLGEDTSQRMEELMQRGARASNGGEVTYEVQLEGRAGGDTGGTGGTMRSRVVMAMTPQTRESDEDTSSGGIPGPVRRRDVDRLSTELGLGADSKPIVLSVHDDYVERFSALRDGLVKQLDDAERAKWSMDPETSQMRGPTTAQVDAAAQLRSQVMEEIHALDESLFNDIATASGRDEHDPIIEHARMKRQREVYVKAATGGGRGMFGPGGGGPGGGRPNGRDRGPGGRGMPDGGGNDFAEATIDVSKLVDDLSLDGNAQKSVSAVMSEYDTTATAALKNLYEARKAESVAMERAMAKAMADRAKEGDNGRGPGGFGAAFRDIEGERAATREAEKAARTLNRDSLAKFSAALPGDFGGMLTRSYHLQAYPEVFNDSRSAEVQVTSALQMNDLNDEQRQQINQAALEYRGNYQQISEKMVKVMQDASDNDPMQNRDWAAFQQRQQALEKLRFERNDLNDGMRSKLRVILSDEQVKRIPGMKEEE